MKIATAPVNWNNDDAADYREWTPYPQLLDEMVRAGYDVTEWGMNMPKDSARMVGDLKQRGLQMLGGFVGLELRNPKKRDEEIERGFEIGCYFKSIGGNYLIAADSGDARRRQEAGHVDSAGGLNSEQRKSLAEGLNELGRRLRPEGVRVVFHNHVGTYVETESETACLLDETDPELVSWCLDCGHLTYGGGDNLKMLGKHGERVGFVHIKDVDGAVLKRSRSEGWSFKEALQHFIFAPLGRGIARVPEVVRALRDHGYDGWLVIEQDTTPIDPTKNARENRLYLERLLEELKASS
jgi:inosose dehydratase